MIFFDVLKGVPILLHRHPTDFPVCLQIIRCPLQSESILRHRGQDVIRYEPT